MGLGKTGLNSEVVLILGGLNSDILLYLIKAPSYSKAWHPCPMAIFLVSDPVLDFVEPACGERDIVIMISARSMCVRCARVLVCVRPHLSGP